MDNQHRKIKGYRELNKEEIAAMNNIKALGTMMGEVIDAMEKTDGLDKRWLAIGKTNIQQGLMAITRSVAKPDSF